MIHPDGTPRTEIHLVSDLAAAYEVARQLDAEGYALDMEGILGNYVGNKPCDDETFEDFMHDQGEVNIAQTQDTILDSPDAAFGIVTNNTNQGEHGFGLVTQVAAMLGIPYAHKGMMVDGVELRKKPSGDQSKHFCETVDVNPRQTVLIDDQGVKNAGEAVQAGLGAIIVPDPIGLPREGSKRVEEHTGVRRFRAVEPLIYRSLRNRGAIARVAYAKIAGVDIDLIGDFYDHRAK